MMATAGVGRAVFTAMLWVSGPLSAPRDPSDMVATIQAEDAFDVQAELGRIGAPTLVIGGARDGFYSPELLEVTARGVPDARLLVLPRGTHASVMFDHEARSELARSPPVSVRSTIHALGRDVAAAGTVVQRSEGGPVITFELARELRDAGLEWRAREGDRFVLPDRDLDGRVFTISEMVVEVRRAPIGTLIAFNGTTEWALDSIEQAEAVWLPREEQLREAIGAALLALTRLDDGWRVTFHLRGELAEAAGATASEAYGHAVLGLLRAAS
jgi:hypothetical protein